MKKVQEQKSDIFKIGNFVKISDEEIIKYSQQLSNINKQIDEQKRLVQMANRAGNYSHIQHMRESELEKLIKTRDALRAKLASMTANEAVNSTKVVQFTEEGSNILTAGSTKVGKSKNDIAQYIIDNTVNEYLMEVKATIVQSTSTERFKTAWSNIPPEIQTLLAAISNCVARDEIGVFNTIAIANVKNTEYQQSTNIVPIGIIHLSKRIRMEYGISKLYIRIDKIKSVRAYCINGIEWNNSAFVTCIK